MAKNNEIFEKLITLFLEKTHCAALIFELQKAGENRDVTIPFFANYDKADKIIAELAKKLKSQPFGQINLTDKTLNHLLWLILLIPLSDDEDQDIPAFATLKLTPLLPAYKKLFIKLLKEAEYEEYGTQIDAQNCLRLFMDIVKWVDEQQKPTNEPTGGVYNLYKKIQNKYLFSHFSLGIAAYFFYKIANNVEQDIKHQKTYPQRIAKLTKQLDELKLKHTRKTGAMTKIENQIQNFYRHMERVPPYWEILTEFITLIVEGFECLEESNNEIEGITPDIFWECIEPYCIKKGNISSTLERKQEEFDVFAEATRNHHTIWTRLEKYEKESAEEIVEDSGTQPELISSFAGERIIVGATDVPQNNGCISANGKDAGNQNDIDIKWEEYCHKIILENVSAHQRCGGVIRLRYCWNNWRVISPDRLCAFIGFLEETKPPGYKIFIYTLIESLLSGAGIKKILYEREIKDVRIAPVGLYIPYAEMGLDDEPIPYNPEELYKGFRETINNFNESYPQFSFEINRIIYTGRAWLIDKSNLSPVDVSHCCGSTLPDIKSSLYYISPANLVKRLSDADANFLNHIIKIAKNINFTGGLKTHNKLIKSSILYWENAKKQLTKKTGLRHDLWNSLWVKKNPITIISEQELNDIFNLLTAKLNHAKKEQNIEDEIIYTAATVIYFTFLLLMLRPCEIKRLTIEHISFATACLFITGKANKEYNENRVIPIPGNLMHLLNNYMKFLRHLDIQYYLSTKKEERKLFPFTSKILCIFENILTGVNLRFELYSFRHTGGTCFSHRISVNESFECLEAIMGHSHEGFEYWGSFSRLQFSALRESAEKFSRLEPWNAQIQTAIKLIEKL